MEYKCSKCKDIFPRADLVIYSRQYWGGKEHLYYMCNTCNTARAKRYRTTPSGKESTTKAVKKYESLNKTRKKAWGIAKWANPVAEPCTKCGKTKDIHRHHPDINLPDKVVFLCSYHHRQAHIEKV